MKIAVFAIAASAMLGGCAFPPLQNPASPPSTPPPDYAAITRERMNNAITSLYGQNIGTAVAILGYPDSQRDVVGDHVYTWFHQQSFPNMYGPPDVATCRIQLGADINNFVKNGTWEGSPFGCAQFIIAFNQR